MLLRFAQLLLISSLAWPAAAAPLVRKEGPATISSAHEYVLESQIAKRQFLIQIADPIRPPKSGETIPVIYVLDADVVFGLATDMARSLQIMGEITPVYVVAIGYPGDSLREWSAERMHDMLDEQQGLFGDKVGGAGKAFRQFLLKELKPFIESRLPVDGRRSYLHGHSLGGLFATTTLLQTPDAFAGYAIGSPSLWIRRKTLAEVETSPRADPGSPKVYVGVGSEEREENLVGDAERLATILKAKGYVIQHRTLPGEGHVTGAAAIYANALKFLVPPPPDTAKR